MTIDRTTPVRAPVTALIADDEDLPRSELRRMLASAWPDLQVVAECEDGLSALEALSDQRPDVAFLDIRMPGASGLAVARAASGQSHVIFTTAYDSHAIEAFEAGAVDYLLKPVQADRLRQAVTRVQQRVASQEAAPSLDDLVDRLSQRWQARDAAAHPPDRLRWISASVGDVIKMFSIDDVLFFQSDEKYTRVVTATDEAHVRKPLKEIVEGLDPDAFWQVHRGVLVRASAVARAQRDEMGRITLHLKQHAETLPVSQAYAWRFKPM
jgi:DNA-binding LytR/AlgR family response regulator